VAGLRAFRRIRFRTFRSLRLPVLATQLPVLLGGRDLGRLAVIGSGSLGGLEHGHQKLPTPATARTGPITLSQLRRATGLFQPQEAIQLASRDVKTEADFLIRVHDSLVLLSLQDRFFQRSFPT
jgi:hypothetical protein